jgi:3-oxoacid CoA-transferase
MIDSLVEEGKIPVRFDASGNVVSYGHKREAREFNGKTYIMETALPGDVAIVRAWKVDEAGNCAFR